MRVIHVCVNSEKEPANGRCRRADVADRRVAFAANLRPYPRAVVTITIAHIRIIISLRKDRRVSNEDGHVLEDEVRVLSRAQLR